MVRTTWISLFVCLLFCLFVCCGCQGELSNAGSGAILMVRTTWIGGAGNMFATMAFTRHAFVIGFLGCSVKKMKKPVNVVNQSTK